MLGREVKVSIDELKDAKPYGFVVGTLAGFSKDYESNTVGFWFEFFPHVSSVDLRVYSLGIEVL